MNEFQYGKQYFSEDLGKWVTTPKDYYETLERLITLEENKPIIHVKGQVIDYNSNGFSHGTKRADGLVPDTHVELWVTGGKNLDSLQAGQKVVGTSNAMIFVQYSTFVERAYFRMSKGNIGSALLDFAYPTQFDILPL